MSRYRTKCLRWACPNCGYVAGFLPEDKSIKCPQCGVARASSFVEVGWGSLDKSDIPRQTLVQVIEGEALRLLVKTAVNSGDGFRQALYPGLPASYEVSEGIKKRVSALVTQGLSALDIAGRIYRELA